MGPEPLPTGIILNNLYRLESILGRGGFGITYLATDLSDRERKVAIKEMAPLGAHRAPGGELDLRGFDSSSLQRLRHGFIQEAQLMQRLRIGGIPRVYDAFLQHSTAYYVSEYFEDAVTLHQHLLEQGPLPTEEARRLLVRLARIVESLHRHRVIHRDIKPSNVLLRRGGHVMLIDFGSAREWAADRSATQTVMHTPGYAPPEQLSERARRGPATDLYGLCATVYHALAGAPPPSCNERVAGAPLPSLAKLRPDADPSLAYAVESGLALSYHERPPDVEALVSLLDNPLPHVDPGSAVRRLDQKIVMLQKLRPDRHECPECGDVLERLKPLKAGVCPVCRSGILKERRVELERCSTCRKGLLRVKSNDAPMRYCPACTSGNLRPEGRLRGLAPKAWSCNQCSYRIDHHPGREEWRQLREDAGRSDKVSECDTCAARYDWLTDGRLKQVHPQPKPGDWLALTPQEWANVAHGWEPGAGNRVCLNCESDWFFEREHATLLGAKTDPHAFAEQYGGRLLRAEDLRWLGVGKSSGAPGWLCHRCGLELDDDPEGLRLAHANTKPLRKLIGKVHSRLDWHRLARELPLEGHESELDEALEQALILAYRDGSADFDSRRPDLLWSGAATLLEPSGEGWAPVGTGKLQAERERLTFSRRFRKSRWRLQEMQVSAEEHVLVVRAANDEETVFELAPVDLQFRLESGKVEVSLCAEDLAARVQAAPRP